MIKLDIEQLKKLGSGFAKYQSILPKSVEQRALRRAVKPIFQAAKQEVPVGRIVSDGGKKGPDYRRGGATRKDLRIKSRRPVGDETSAVWIGPSFGPGKVGWRNHFITGGVKGAGRGRNVNIPPSDYLTRAHDRGIEEAKSTFNGEVDESFKKWAKSNLPQ